MKIFYFILFELLATQLNAQITFDCIPESKQIFTEDLLDKTISCCNKYCKNRSEDFKHMILMVDISIIKDTTSILIEDSYTSKYALLMKRPDAFIRLNNNLALLYSKNYTIANDSLWLEKVYDLCKKTTIVTDYKIVSWKKNIYKKIDCKNKTLNLMSFSIPDFYDPPKIKYVFVNDTLKSIKIRSEIIHKYILTPKDVDQPWLWEEDLK